MEDKKTFSRSISHGYGEYYGINNADQEISEFCDNLSDLNYSDFAKCNPKSKEKSIKQCLKGLRDSNRLHDNGILQSGSTKECRTEIYQDASTQLGNLKNFETFGELCFEIYNKRLSPSIENDCKKLFSTIMYEVESPYRQQHVLPKIRVVNKLVKINNNYKAFAAAVSQCNDKQIEKGFTKLYREKQRTTQNSLNKSKKNCETSFVRVSQKLDHAQHPDDMQILKSLITGYSKKEGVVPFLMVTSMPVQNNIALDNPSRRLLTFSDWPIRTHVWPQQLSNAGFYYTREGTTVRCATCGVNTIVDNWERLDKPEVVHFKLNSNCEFVKRHFSYLKSDHSLEDAQKNPKRSSTGIGASVEHGTTVHPNHETNEKEIKHSKTEGHCHNVTSSSTGNSDVCVSDTTLRGLNVNNCLQRSSTSYECDSLNENLVLKSPDKTGPMLPSSMDNERTRRNIWTGLPTHHNHVSNISLNNSASGSSTTDVDNNRHYNASRHRPNKDQLYISGHSKDYNTHTLQNNAGLVSNGMTTTGDATFSPQSLFNTQLQSTVGQNINSQNESINMDATVSNNQLDQRQTSYGQASLSPVNGQEASFNRFANQPTPIISKLQSPFKSNAYSNSIDLDVPVSANQSEQVQTVYEPEFSHPNFKRFQDRMESYSKWPITAKQQPQILAESGCFYTGKDDIVRCFSCNLGLAEWAETDDPWIEHARHNPKCWFLRREKGQPFIDMIQGEWQKRYKPKNPAFDDVLSRLATFDGWRDDIEQTPEDLADAGFFSTGEDDIVRCHYCDGGLRNWESGDIPWEEHARWFPHCKYLIKMKGMQYIESIKEKYQRHEASVNTTNTTEEQGDNQLLATENAKTVLRMGFPVNTVKSAINNLIRTRGHSNFSTEDVLEFILNPVESSQTPMRTSNEASGQATRPFPVERDPAKLKVINTELKNNLLCVICRKNERCMLFANCGHRVTCEQCCRSIDFCPHCDKRIKKTVKTYMS